MIFYFSGTGNSRWVAECLAQNLGDRLVPVGDALVSGELQYALAPGEMLGFVFPTYSWGPAPVIVEFARRMVIEGYNTDTYCYMVTTCGDDVGLSPKMWQETLGSIKMNAAYSVQMPNNYILMPGFDVDAKDLEEKKKREAVGRVALIAERIRQRWEGVDVIKGAMAWLKSRVIYPWFRRYSMTDNKFTVDADKCTRCGLCERTCPIHNVKPRENGLPSWHGNCAMCLGCIHRCPTRAIQYARATQSKGRYFFHPLK